MILKGLLIFINPLEDFGFTQHVHGPTPYHGHTLDLVVSKRLNVDKGSQSSRSW